MKDQIAEEIVDRYLAGESSAEEQALVETWYNGWSDQQKGGAAIDYARRYQQLVAGLPSPKETKVIKLWPRISITAAVVAAVVFGFWYYNAQNNLPPSPGTRTQYTNDIGPGKNKATLTLADGKVIPLSEAQKNAVIAAGKLSYNDGTEVSSLQRNVATVSTPRGGTYQVTLSDGTRVWLNAESTLQFPSTFTGADQRKVTLKGEAYFEVAKVKTKEHRVPFIVESKGQKVEVLGTHFNINAYADEESIKTTLLEGSVRVNQSILTPGHESVLSNGNIKINKVDPDDAIDWKNGEFVCKNEPLNNIMRKVARWYDVDVVYAHPELKNLTFSGSLSRYDHVSGILNALGQAGTIRFKLEGRKIQIL